MFALIKKSFDKLLCSRLSVLKLNKSGESIAQTHTFQKGRYRLSGLNTELQSISALELSAPCDEKIEIDWSSKKFELSLSPKVKLIENRKYIWKAESEQSPQKVKFEWNQTPSDLQLSFPNGETFKIEVSRQLWKPSFSLVFSVLLIAASCLHIMAGSLVTKAAKNSLQKVLQKKEELIDISKVEVRVLQKQEPTSRSKSLQPALSAEARKAKQMARLLKNWGVGKPIKHANQKLPETAADKFFKSEFTKSSADGPNQLNAWQLSEDDYNFEDNLENLNISPTQIAAALSPVVPRLQECYEEVLLKDSSLSGNPKLWIDINEQGRVENVSIENLRAKKKNSVDYLQNCFQKAYRNIRMPKQPNQAFSVTRTLLLSTQI